MVAQMLVQSATRLASVVTMPFGLPVEPEVSLIRRASAGRAGRVESSRVVTSVRPER